MSITFVMLNTAVISIIIVMSTTNVTVRLQIIYLVL